MPFLDVVTNERDTSLPLTVPEWEEWGDPLHNSTDYQYMLTYSPVDNIRRCLLPLPPWPRLTRAYDHSTMFHLCIVCLFIRFSP